MCYPYIAHLSIVMGRVKGTRVEKKSGGRRIMSEALKLKRRANGKKRKERSKMYVEFRRNYDNTIKNSLDSHVVPCLGTLLDLLSGEDVSTSQQQDDCVATNFCEFSTWARKKHCTEAKLFELKAKLKAVIVGLREITTRLHEEFGTKRLSFVQKGKEFFPVHKNGCP